MRQLQTAAFVLSLGIAAAALIGWFRARRRRFRLVAQALAHPDPDVRLAGVAVAVDEGLDRYAAQLVHALQRDDVIVTQAIREAALHAGPPRPGDPWAELLRTWVQVPAAPIDRTQQRAGSESRAARRTVDVVRLFAVGATVLDLLAISLATWLTGRYTTAFSAFPKGYDAWGHISKSTLVLIDFPHLAWNDAWYGGVPYSQTYPPGYHLAVALIAWTSGVSVAEAIAVLCQFSIVGLALASYGLVRTLTGSRSAALISAGFLVVSRPIWTYALIDGLYPRLLSITFFGVALLALAVWLRKPSPLSRFCLVLALAACMATHLLVGTVATCVIAALLWRLAPRSLVSPWRAVLSVVGVSLAINSYLLLPLLIAPHALGSFTDRGRPVPPLSLLWPGAGIPEALPTALLPLTAALTAAGVASLRRPLSPLRGPLLERLGSSRRMRSRTNPQDMAGGRLALDKVWARLSNQRELLEARRRWDERWYRLRTPLNWTSVLGGVGILFIVYCTAGTLGRFPFYAPGVRSGQLLMFPALLLSVVSGILLGALMIEASARWRLFLPLASAISVALSGVAGLAGLPHESVAQDGAARVGTVKLLPQDAVQHDYRVHGPPGVVTDSIDTRGNVPQTGGYQVEAVVHPEWQAWLEKATSDRDAASIAERKFLFDWYAVKWVYAGPGERESSLQASQPEVYDLVGSSSVTPYQVFAYREARPILSASIATSVLVVGKWSDYNYVVRSLALAGVGSDAVVPVIGRQMIDQYSLDELRRFNALFLYGFSFRDGRHAASLLADYVRGGGGLIVDAGDSPQLAARLRADPIPIDHSSAELVDQEWDFAERRSTLTQSLSLARFSPPAYGRGPWAIATGDVKPWADAALLSGGRPVLVSGRFGQGRVVWSGLNLPYHVALFRNPAEAELLAAEIADATTSNPDRSQPSYRTSYLNGEARSITLNSAVRGVLFKETRVDDWHAVLNGRELPVYEAGPGMMYAPVAESTPPGSTVTFSYRPSVWESLADLVSIATGVLFVLMSLHLTEWSSLQQRASWCRGILARNRRRRGERVNHS